MYGHGRHTNGHGRHHAETTVRLRAAGFALRHLGQSAVTRRRLASWRRGSRYPSQRYDGSLPPLSGQACRPVRSGHGSLRRAHCDRAHCERLAETRRRLRSGRDRDAHRSPRLGCSWARCCSRRPGCSGTRHSRACGCSLRPEGCSGYRCSRTPGWSPAIRRRRPCVSYRGCRHPHAPRSAAALVPRSTPAQAVSGRCTGTAPGRFPGGLAGTVCRRRASACLAGSSANAAAPAVLAGAARRRPSPAVAASGLAAPRSLRVPATCSPALRRPGSLGHAHQPPALTLPTDLRQLGVRDLLMMVRSRAGR